MILCSALLVHQLKPGGLLRSQTSDDLASQTRSLSLTRDPDQVCSECTHCTQEQQLVATAHQISKHRCGTGRTLIMFDVRHQTCKAYCHHNNHVQMHVTQRQRITILPTTRFISTKSNTKVAGVIQARCDTLQTGSYPMDTLFPFNRIPVKECSAPWPLG